MIWTLMAIGFPSVWRIKELILQKNWDLPPSKIGHMKVVFKDKDTIAA